MARFTVPNKTYIQQDDAKYGAAFAAIERAISAQSDQTNSNPTGATQAPPPPVDSISVVEAGGIHDIKISDAAPAYAGINYVAEYSQTPDFQNSHAIDMGISQNHRVNLGAGKYYWRASSFYHPATPSTPVYHGGSDPQAVGSGAYPGPAMQARQGFTGPYRNSPTPPVRQ